MKPLPIAAFLTSILIALILTKDRDRILVPPGWNWDEKLDSAWKNMQRSIGARSHLGDVEVHQYVGPGAAQGTLSWSMLRV